MSRITFHLLTEAEPFSEFAGGAISRWAGNVLRGASHSIVVCPQADESWNLEKGSVWQLPTLALYKHLRRRLQQLPWSFHVRAIREVLRPLTRRIRPGDIVWIHNRPEFALAITAPVQRAGGRVVLHLHNSHLAEGPERLMREVHADRFVFVSKFLLSQARNKFPVESASVVYNGADSSIFYPASDNRDHQRRVRVLFAGRLVENKGVHILLDAMKLLEQQGVELDAEIVGSTAFGLGKETAYSRRLKIFKPANVAFLPYQSGAALGDLFRRADMFCSPSLWDEPFGLVNVEALACGLPVVSTDGGGAREIFADGGGILVERGSVVQLACALRRLAEDRDLRANLGKQGYQSFLQRFTWAHARKQVELVEQTL
jgi:spore coat protein SA